VVTPVGEQRRHLRQGGGLLGAPAGAFADVGEGEGGLAAALVCSHLAEERRLLGAGHVHGCARAEACLESRDLAAAELGMHN
jgi:hypothetical protein